MREGLPDTLKPSRRYVAGVTPSGRADMSLTDGVILLRPFQPHDAKAHLAGEDDEQVKWLSGGVSTRDSVLAWIERNRLSWQNDGPTYNFAICPAADRRCVGMIEANTRVPGLRAGVANLSYGLYAHARGRGWATRAVMLVLEYMRVRGDVSIAVIQVHPENERSLRLPRRCGFRCVGRRISPEGDTLETFVRPVRPRSHS